jgi:hypothetical protein
MIYLPLDYVVEMMEAKALRDETNDYRENSL